jgi:hypothetical protein
VAGAVFDANVDVDAPIIDDGACVVIKGNSFDSSCVNSS